MGGPCGGGCSLARIVPCFALTPAPATTRGARRIAPCTGSAHISGGLSGLGLVGASVLSALGVCRFVLMGRSAVISLPPETPRPLAALRRSIALVEEFKAV